MHLKLLCAALAGSILALPMQGPVTSANQPAQQDSSAKPPAPPANAPSSSQQSASQALPAAKPSKKHARVYTDDDLKKAGILSLNGEQLDLTQLNECNRDCFNRVRQAAHPYSVSDAYWRRDVLASIEAVRKDAEWQSLLVDIYRLHLKFCDLASEKRAELAKVADPSNVTEREIDTEEKYDSKFKVLQTVSGSLYQRESAVQNKYASNSNGLAFMNIQLSRIQGSGCPVDRQPEPSSGDPDDPSDP